MEIFYIIHIIYDFWLKLTEEEEDDDDDDKDDDDKDDDDDDDNDDDEDDDDSDDNHSFELVLNWLLNEDNLFKSTWWNQAKNLSHGMATWTSLPLHTVSEIMEESSLSSSLLLSLL